jgi:hypothetical protein
MPPVTAPTTGWHDDVADQRLHDGAESRADDHADGEIDHIAAQREFLELGKHSSTSTVPSVQNWERAPLVACERTS